MAKLDLRERFNDAALAGQRLEGWLAARRDYEAMLEKITAWRKEGPVSPLDSLSESQAETQRFYEAVELKLTLNRLKEQADSGMVTLVSDCFYRDAYFAAINRNERERFSERETGYKSYWNDMKALLDERIESLNDSYKGDPGMRSELTPTDLASSLRLKTVAQLILKGNTADQSFDKVYAPQSPRGWFPPAVDAGFLPDEKTQMKDLEQNKYEQLTSNVISLMFAAGSLNPPQQGDALMEKIHADQRRFLSLWFVTLVKEYDAVRPLIDRDLAWFDKTMNTVSGKTGITVAEARAQDQVYALPFRPLWSMQPSNPLSGIRLSPKPAIQ